jgi:hypothetical protein
VGGEKTPQAPHARKNAAHNIGARRLGIYVSDDAWHKAQDTAQEIYDRHPRDNFLTACRNSRTPLVEKRRYLIKNVKNLSFREVFSLKSIVKYIFLCYNFQVNAMMKFARFKTRHREVATAESDCEKKQRRFASEQIR